MTASKVILWRHGQTDLNIEGRIQGGCDFPLNARGREQARLVAPHIASLAPTKIVASPLSRAHDTAKAAAELLGLDIELDARLQERNYGKWEKMTREEILAKYPDEYRVWRQGGQPEGVDVEPNSSVGERMYKAVTEHATRMESGILLVVAHGGAIRTGVTRLLGLDPEWPGIYGMDNCHWAALSSRPGKNPEWMLTSYNRTVPTGADFLTEWTK
ncbi:histidine phosphatase family protein [Arcanobacterium haemolyticum]|nr:histidine phosphatase family protein [Arcanobacterium haemolyticum]